MPEGAKKMGRPVGSSLPPERQTKPRSVRMTDARWEKLKQLQRAYDGWLDKAIDKAKLPE